MASARFRYYPADGYLEVIAEDGPDFRGRGLVEAAFDAPYGEGRGIQLFLAALDQYPMSAAEMKMRTLGHIHIRVEQVDPFGHLILELQLSDHIDGSEATIRFSIDYEALTAFARNLRAMIKADTGDFTLEGSTLRFG